jgi:hypothetical protein
MHVLNMADMTQGSGTETGPALEVTGSSFLCHVKGGGCSVFYKCTVVSALSG